MIGRLVMSRIMNQVYAGFLRYQSTGIGRINCFGFVVVSVANGHSPLSHASKNRVGHALRFFEASLTAARAGHDPAQPPLLGRLHFRLLDGAGGVDVLGADLAALAHEGALPNTFVAEDRVLSLLTGAVARVKVVALGQGDRGRA